jgi:hypothetical protein
MPFDTRSRWYTGSESRTEANVTSVARTATATGTAFNSDDIGTIVATLVITAVSGTNPTLDVILETTADGSVWTTVAAFAQQTTTQAGLGKVFGPLGSQCRWSWTIGGTSTPTFTFAITSTVKRTG